MTGDEPYRDEGEHKGQGEHCAEDGHAEHTSLGGIVHILVVVDVHIGGELKVNPPDAGLGERDERHDYIAGDGALAAAVIAEELA